MGHNIMHEVYPENVDRNKVQRDWDNYVAHADRGEGCGGLSKKIRWLEGHVCDSYEDAENYIRQKTMAGTISSLFVSSSREKILRRLEISRNE